MILTDKAIRDAKPKSSTYRLRDSNVVCRGFGLAVGPTGAKAFFLSYTSPEDGKRKQAPLGRFPTTSLREARLKAAEVRAQVDAGRDPATEKKQVISKRVEQREQGTLQDLMDLYADDLKADGKRTEKEVRRITGRDIPRHLLSRPARLINRDDILDILTPIAQRDAKVHSDNVRAYLRAAFELGLNAPSMTRWRGRSKSFGITANPVIGVRKSVSRKPRGQRFLTSAEVRLLWSTDALSPPTLLALKLILATGQRVEEVLGAKWQEIEREESLWTIPGERRKTRNKSDEAHIVPIGDFHHTLLAEIRLLYPNSHYLFPDRGGKSPKRHDSLNSSLQRWVKETGIPSFSPRDLRRTFKTLGGAFGIPLEVRNRLQGHAMTDVGSIFYDRHDYLAEKREAMQKWVESFKLIIG